MKYLILDYETQSEADLKKVGAYEYAKHPSTKIMCAAWCTIEYVSAIKSWSPLLTKEYPFELIKLLCNPEYNIVAHNAFFEKMITKFVLSNWDAKNEILANIFPNRWVCTAATAAALALPRNLENACIALDLPVKKDMEGRKLMLKYSKPRRPTKNNPAKWHSNLDEIKRIVQYCETDVRAETLLFKKLKPLHPFERKIWLLDQKINERGLTVDGALIDAGISLAEKEKENLNKRLSDLTNGEIKSAARVESLLCEINKEDVVLLDLGARTIRDTLNFGKVKLTPRQKELIDIRQNFAKSSTSKYVAFKNRMGKDSRIRDLLMYHGASTGRWTALGPQLQNLARGSIKEYKQLSENVKENDLELLRFLYGNPLEALSSALRSVLIARDGYEFFCGDYSAIEARALLWVAQDYQGLEVYKQGLDPYKIMASKIFNVSVLEVTKEQRELGKRVVLACGYNMGWKTFKSTCEQFAIFIEAALAKKAVQIFRESNPRIVTAWSTTEKAAIHAVLSGKKITINRCTWWVDKKSNFLFCDLPIGRSLAYYGPEIKLNKTPWGEEKPTLYHWGVHPKTKQWVLDGTYGGKLVENIVQSISRDLMTEAMLNLEAAGFEIKLTVHDEVLSEARKGTKTLEEFGKIMSTNPKWALDLPLKVEAWCDTVYHK